MVEPNPNLEKFLPALLGIIGRVASAAGKAGIGGGEEEEKSMDKAAGINENMMNYYRDAARRKKAADKAAQTGKAAEEVPSEYTNHPNLIDTAKPKQAMYKQQIEKTLLKLMKADVPESKKIGELTTYTPGGKTTKDEKGVTFSEGEEGRKQMEAWWAQNFPKATGAKEHLQEMQKHYPGDEGYDTDNKQHQNAMSEAIRPYDDRHYDDDDRYDSRYDNEYDDSRYDEENMGGVSVSYGAKGEQARRMSGIGPYDEREEGKGLTNLSANPPEDDPEFGMGELEQRIARKPRNQPTYPMRDRGTSPESRKEEKYQHYAGRPIPQQGATPSLSASVKALNKMLQEGFLSKKADPSQRGANIRDTRQRGAETQANIRRVAEGGAQAVSNVAPNTEAQQLGAGIIDSAIGTWQSHQMFDDRNDQKDESDTSNAPLNLEKPWQQANTSSAVNNLNEHVAEQDANTPGTSGLYGPDNQPLPASSPNAKQQQDMTITPKFNPAAEGMSFQSKPGPTTKPAAGNTPDLTNPSWKQAAK